MGGQVGRIWEEQREGKLKRNILCEKKIYLNSRKNYLKF